MAINKITRDKIVAQALQEIDDDRRAKRGRIQSWHKTENMYYAKKEASDDTRANVELGSMQSFIHTLLSKTDAPMEFKYTKKKASQLKRVEQLNALKRSEADRDFWDLKDLAGKKQAYMYGRTIYCYYASSIDGYKSHLEPVDVYDFLIDRRAGGINIEQARHLGRYGIIKTEEELRDGIKSGAYFKTETLTLLQGGGNMTEQIQEDLNKKNRDYGNEMYGVTEVEQPGEYKFWEWFTTYMGKRYYLLLSPQGSTAIVCEEWKDRDPSNLWPFWTWACFLDLTEFWTPSYAEYVRETMMGQSVSINQLIDNSTQINDPQKLVNVSAIENLAELKYRRNGYIKVKGDFDVNKALQKVDVASLDNPIKVYEILSSIQDRNSGVTAGSQGVADPDGKATIYEGNQANIADGFGLLNKTYSFGYKRFAKLFENGAKYNLTEKVSIEILGPDGIEIKDVDKDDIFSDMNESFGTLVESSSAEMALSLAEQRIKTGFLQTNSLNPIQNPKKAYELGGKIAGFDEETMRQLMFTDEFGSEELMSEADRDIERILMGEQVQPNLAANIAYKQRFVDYLADNTEDLDQEQWQALSTYLSGVSQIIDRNMVRKLNEKRIEMLSGPIDPPQPGAAPMLPPTTNEERITNSLTQV